MRVVSDRADLRSASLPGDVAVVMTMGALHEGHAALLRRARAEAKSVLMTLFVNPLQFGPNEDFDRYPRTMEADLELARAEGVDLVFAPTREVMYPQGEPSVRVEPGPLGTVLEGASRPGFFHGVLTVVNKLLQLTRPDYAYFGEKDYQQLTLIRAMVRDFDLPIDVRGVPTVREADGLALSSRNRYLSPPERQSALVLSRALRATAATGSIEAGLAEFAAVPEVKLDYLVLTDPMLGPAPDHGPARALTAARVGSTRLIDNVGVELP
ncbi:pantoate--beta-alanine ligase [Dactylosporangium vinaceum]|uniref:Pantothenate synthetase n=1 Tax=Dactylosporangium vinaceum TaxID=53362 RepID=A0ABV5MLT6_9ACTN|nr:pantoate--beta-alanine ligase [Dactylosporangium vinaceum]UAB96868.1 pantoate--beta-alanine ligase [Dactylosporangium vinaceum]